MEPTTIAALTRAGWKLVKWLTDKPKKKKLSPVYKVREDEIRISEESALPIVYGHCKVKGQNIYREDTIASVVDMAVAFCEGEIEGFEDIRINDIPIDKLADAVIYYEVYTGTTTQIGDDIFKKGIFNLTTTDDTYVSSDYPDSNLHWWGVGLNKMMYEQKVAGVEKLRAYMRFDLSEIPVNITFDSAEIKVMAKDTSPDPWHAATIGVFAGATASDWADDTLTWNNKPADAFGASLHLKYLGTNNKVEEFPLNGTAINYITTQHQANSFVTFFFQGTGDDSYISISALESEYLSPTLILHYSGGEPCGYRNTAYIACRINTSKFNKLVPG